MAGVSRSADGATLSFHGRLTYETVPRLTDDLQRLDLRGVRRIDCSAVEETDSAGVALIELARERAGPAVDLEGGSERLRDTLSLFTVGTEGARERGQPRALLRGSRERLRRSIGGFREYLRIAADSLGWTLVDLLGRGKRPRGSFFVQSLRIGVQSIGIIGLLSFILGFIVALQSAAQLRLFGANIYVVNLLALFVVREMGPMLTAVLVAGRSGSAIAAEIATMKVTEELDALRVMGVNPLRYVVVPKVLAITAVMPVLTMISMLVAVAGGMLISVPYLGLSAHTFIGQLLDVLSPADVVTGFAKSVVFAWQIVIVAAYYGLQAEGGAEGVGVVTTKSVVASIFSVIVIDVFFSFVYLT
ncbi:MAG: ABC transporter permease [Spirochaetaceae bacterium]